MRIRTTLYNQKQRSIAYRAENPIPRGIIKATLTATDQNNEKIIEQDSYTIPDSSFRRAPIISLAGNTIYTRDDTVFIYFNNKGGPVKLYTMITPLPSGVSLDSTSGFITGTALIRQPNTKYFIKAENDFGFDILEFSIRILYKPPIISYTGSPFNFIKGTLIDPITMNNSSDPVENVIGSLPPGLLVNSITGIITGTPTEVSPFQSYFITASNEGGTSTAEIQSQVWIEAPFFIYSYGPYIYTVSNSITPITPTGIIGDPIFYTALPPAIQLPTGLSINSNTGVISGTPTIVTSSNEYIIKGSNLGPNGVREYAAYFGMEIMHPPPNISYTPSSVTFTQNSLITDMIPTNTGGPITTYSITPSLPSGIILDTTTGIISGMPLVDSSSQNYVVTATGNGTSPFTINITINPAAPIISYTSPQNYTIGNSITPLIPTSSGGTVASYSALTALPIGLILNTSNGIISGTPTSLSYISNYTIQASNVTGTSTAYLDIAIIRPIGIGSFIWAGALSFTNASNNFVTGVATDNNNNAYVTGHYLAPTSAVVYSSNISSSNSSSLPTNPVARVGYYSKYDPQGQFIYSSAIMNAGATSNNLCNNSICTDVYDNVYICGRWSGSANAYNSNQSSTNVGILPFTGSDGTYGAYAAKFNPQGSNVLNVGFVAFTTISLGIAEATDIKVDSAGSIYISGFYRGASSSFIAAFCNSTQISSNFLPTTTGTNFNSFLVKFNSNGSFGWGAAIGNITAGNSCSNFSMTIDSSDNIYLAGTYSGSNASNIYIYNSNNSSSNSNVFVPTNTSRDSYIVKFGSNGIFASTASINACNSDSATSIVRDSLNNIYVTGYYQGLSNTTYIVSSNKSSSNSNVLPSITPTTGFAQYLVKFNNNLQFQMALAVDGKFGSTNSNNTSTNIDYDGNIYMVGTCSNSCNTRVHGSNMSTVSSNLIRTGSGNASYMFCFGSNGQVKYGTSIANSITFISKSIATNQSSSFDYIYFAGTYSNSSNTMVAYDSNSNYYSSNILPTPILSGTSNTYLVKYQIVDNG